MMAEAKAARAIAEMVNKSFPISCADCLKASPPEGSNRTSQERVKWLEAAARCFDLMYAGGDGKISVTVMKDS